MREQFQRGAKVTFAIRKPDVGRDLRAALVDRIRPMVDYVAAELAELAARRFETDLDRIGEALEIGVSAFASEVASADSDRRNHDPLPDVPRGTGRGLHGDEQGDRPRATGPDRGEAPRSAAQAASPRRAEDERASRLVAAALGPELDAMLNAPPPPPSVRLSSIGRRIGAIVCSMCGFVGGNARGCGTAHETRATATASPVLLAPPTRAKSDPNAQPMTAIEPNRPRAPTPGEVEAAKARIARIAARRNAGLPRRLREPAPDENVKLAGELPVPRSSFRVTPPSGGRAYDCHDQPGDVEEIEVDA